MMWKNESIRHSLASQGVKTTLRSDGRRKRRRDVSPDLKKLEMNEEVYKLRKKIIDIIYEAKEIADLPYITVRVTEPGIKVVDGKKYEIGGQALLEGNILWIPDKIIDEDKDKLRMIVYHEILHAVYGVPHIDRCVLRCINE